MSESPVGSDAVIIPRSLLHAFAAGRIAIWLPRDSTTRLRYITIERDVDSVIVERRYRDALMLTRARYPNLAKAVAALAENGWLREGWQPAKQRFGE